ncbi:MAG: permease-like cell division protein FtsX [Aquisalimonadaceae bacterium]
MSIRARAQPRRAASGSATGRLLAGWVQAHGRAAVGALGRLSRTRMASAMTTAVLGIALALPAVFLLLLQNVEGVTADWDGGATVSLFMAPGLAEADYRSLAADLRLRDDVRSTDVVTPDAALEDFRARSGMDTALDLLDENPLPPLVIVVPAAELGADALQSLSQELGALSGVETARLDLEWVQRLHAVMDLLRRAIWLVAGLLAVTVILVVGNTIRLAIENRRDEIIITKLIGGTDAFIRRPFLYEGVWYGAFGGVLAALLVEVVRLALAGPAADLARLYQTAPLLQGLGAGGMLAVISSGVMLGLVGSWLAVGRHLAAIEPK